MKRTDDERLDAELADTFPASDPLPWRHGDAGPKGTDLSPAEVALQAHEILQRRDSELTGILPDELR
jgi:hypothetical protein